MIGDNARHAGLYLDDFSLFDNPNHTGKEKSPHLFRARETFLPCDLQGDLRFRDDLSRKNREKPESK